MSSYGRGDTFSLESCVDFTDPNVLDRIDAWGLDDLLGPNALNRDMATQVRYDNDAKKGICVRHLRFQSCPCKCEFDLHLLGRQGLGSRADPSSEINGRLTRCLCGAPLRRQEGRYCSLQGACLLAAPALLEIHNAPPRNPPLPTVAFSLGAGPDLLTNVTTRNALLDAAALVTGRKRPVVVDVVLERCKCHVDGKACPSPKSCHRLHVLGRTNKGWCSKSRGARCLCGGETKGCSRVYLCRLGDECPLSIRSMLLIEAHGSKHKIWFASNSAPDLSDAAARQLYLDEVALLKRLLVANPTGTQLLLAHHAASLPPAAGALSALAAHAAPAPPPRRVDPRTLLPVAPPAPPPTPDIADDDPLWLAAADAASALADEHERDKAAAAARRRAAADAAQRERGAFAGLAPDFKPACHSHAIVDGRFVRMEATTPAKVRDAPLARCAPPPPPRLGPPRPRYDPPTMIPEQPLLPPRGHHSQAVELDALRDLTTNMKVSPPRMRTADRAAGLAQFEDEPRPGTADTADTAPVAPKRELEFSSPKRNKAKASIGAADGSRKPQFKKSPKK